MNTLILILAVFGGVCLATFALAGLYNLFKQFTEEEVIEPIKRPIFRSPWFLRRRYGLRWK